MKNDKKDQELLSRNDYGYRSKTDPELTRKYDFNELPQDTLSITSTLLLSFILVIFIIIGLMGLCSYL